MLAPLGEEVFHEGRLSDLVCQIIKHHKCLGRWLSFLCLGDLLISVRDEPLYGYGDLLWLCEGKDVFFVHKRLARLWIGCHEPA